LRLIPFPIVKRLELTGGRKGPIMPHRLSLEDLGVPLSDPASLNLLPGTLDLLILKILSRGSTHGYGIAEQLKSLSDDVLQVGESSLYPALQRLLLNGWVKAEWGASENNRRARYYTLTTTGRKQLRSERDEFDQIISAIQKVLQTA
jgi:PadR family transcriptional regulator, regulatory protein PadR